MSRVVPTQVVALIDELFPFATTQTEDEQETITVNLDNARRLRAIVDLVREVPDELMILEGPSYTNLVLSVTTITTAVSAWLTWQKIMFIDRLPGPTKLNPVTVIRKSLVLCPDEYPSPGTNELSFIEDQDLRDSLRQDIGRVNTALSNGEWKATTILAGSVVEALLLWRLERCSIEHVLAAKNKLLQKGILTRKSGNNLKSWELHPYIEVAADLDVVKVDTATQARLAKDFRNLIHPGREIRLGLRCDRGTALSAVAAVELVVRDLTSRTESL